MDGAVWDEGGRHRARRRYLGGMRFLTIPRRRLVGAAVLALAGLPALAQFTPNQPWDPRARANSLSDADIAYCTAVLKGVVETQGAAIWPGDNEARDRLVSVTKSGFAFVGAMIKTGAKREYADSLLEQAEAVVDKQEASTSPEQRALVRRQCEEVGAALLKRASSVERAFISYKAKKEVERYLAKAAQRR